MHHAAVPDDVESRFVRVPAEEQLLRTGGKGFRRLFRSRHVPEHRRVHKVAVRTAEIRPLDDKRELRKKRLRFVPEARLRPGDDPLRTVVEDGRRHAPAHHRIVVAQQHRRRMRINRLQALRRLRTIPDNVTQAQDTVDLPNGQIAQNCIPGGQVPVDVG